MRGLIHGWVYSEHRNEIGWRWKLYHEYFFLRGCLWRRPKWKLFWIGFMPHAIDVVLRSACQIKCENAWIKHDAYKADSSFNEHSCKCLRIIFFAIHHACSLTRDVPRTHQAHLFFKSLHIDFLELVAVGKRLYEEIFSIKITFMAHKQTNE